MERRRHGTQHGRAKRSAAAAAAAKRAIRPNGSTKMTALYWAYNVARHFIAPLFLIVATSPLVQVLAFRGNEARAFDPAILRGNSFSWWTLLVCFSWALLFLHMPSKKHLGAEVSPSSTEQVVYQANGVLYYWASLVAFTMLQFFVPSTSVLLFENMPEILATLNIAALLLCTYLLVKGRRNRRNCDLVDSNGATLPPMPIVFEFYRGLEVNPRILGVDVKQLTNCRVGMMLWQIIVFACYFAGVEKHGFTHGFLTNLLLQSIYIAKFFWWETGYFHTLDITLDRAGYYICWGCLVWVPCFYAYSSYYFVEHPPVMGVVASWIFLIVGILAITLNYRVDYEKEYFRQHDGRCNIWGKPATYVETEYVVGNEKRKGKLLTCGFWGIARHTNYTFELLSAFCWSVPGLGLGLWPFLYFIFLTGLLLHRIYRDEDKCKKKYGAAWDKYCQLVRYRLIPYLY